MQTSYHQIRIGRIGPRVDYFRPAANFIRSLSNAKQPLTAKVSGCFFVVQRVGVSAA